VTEILLS